MIIDLEEQRQKTYERYKNLLNEKYGITINRGNEEDAMILFNKLESLESDMFYEFSDKGNLSGFYSKVMADILMKEFKFINITGEKHANLIFKDGYYQMFPELSKHIENKLSRHDKAVNKNIDETLKVLAIRTRIDSNLANSNTNIINFKNGIYDIDKKELLSHNSDFISTIQIKTSYVDYNINSIYFQESLFYKYLSTSFNVEIIPTIQEMFGYCLSSFTEAQKMFILLGEGKNGKSVFISILNAFFDNEFISSVELRDLTRHEFAARLHNKALNTCADISAEYMKSTGLLKQIIGEDMFEARPLYSNPFSFKNRAKMVFSANELPSTNDKSYAFIRRLIIINCNKKIAQENIITNLASKIISSEMELIASWAIEGLQRLISNNFKFTSCKELDESIESYMMHNNSISSFINNFCVIDNSNDCFIPKTEFMELYKKYCNSENIIPLGSKILNQTMSGLNVYEKKHTLYKGRYWNNISWNQSILEFTEKFDLLGTLLENEESYNKLEREGIKNES